MTQGYLELMIENWVRWHRQALRYHRRGCKSIEHRWKSPQAWDAPPITPLGRVDVLAARDVEDVWKTLPFVPKVVLKEWFVLRRPSGQICRSLRRKGYPVIDRDFELELARAKLMLGEQLDAAKKNTDTSPVAVVREPEARVGGLPSLRQAA